MSVEQAPLPPSASSEHRTRSLADLAAAQGVTGPQDFDAIFGAGADLWKDDADFDNYLATLRESRRRGD